MKLLDVSADEAVDEVVELDVVVDATVEAVVAVTLMADSSRFRARRAPECLQDVLVSLISVPY
jgi:hypothetical protein